jgi:hypothetical protein
MDVWIALKEESEGEYTNTRVTGDEAPKMKVIKDCLDLDIG